MATENPGASQPGGLTRREYEVLKAIAEGLPNKKIAVELSISQQTVKAHAKQIYRKLGATSRYQAILIYHDLLTPKSNSDSGMDGAM